MTTLTVGDKAVYHPAELGRAAQEYGYPSGFLGVANAISIPIGMEPGRAYMMMTRGDVQEIQEAGAAVDIKWKDDFSDLTFKNWYFVRAGAVSPGKTDDKDVFMLAEFEDKRRVMKMAAKTGLYYNWKMWGKFGTSDAATYAPDTINSGTAWTWQEVLDDLWDELPSGLSLSTSPTLPYSPEGNPENVSCDGRQPWVAYNELLRYIDCDVKYDPISDAFTIIQLGTEQSELSDSMENLEKKGRLEFDYSPLVMDSANIPENVLVCFQSRDQDAGGGGSQTTSADASNGRIWGATTFRAIEKATGVSGAITGTSVPIYDLVLGDYTEGGTLITDIIDLDARAEELKDNFVARLQTSNARMRKVYAGLVDDILPGSEVKVVTWSDYGGDEGIQTDIINTTDGTIPNDVSPPQAEMAHMQARMSPPLAAAPWIPPDNVIAQADASSDEGENASGFFSGVMHFLAGDNQESYATDVKACWIKIQPNSEITADARRLVDSAYYYGKVAGIATHSGDTRPLVWVPSSLLTAKALWVNFELTADLTTSDATATADVLSYKYGVDPDPTSAGITVYNRLRSDGAYEYFGTGATEYVTGSYGYAIFDPKLDRYYIFDLECDLT